MAKSILWAMTWVFLAWPVFAAEKIRIGFPEFNSSTFTLPYGADQRILSTKKDCKRS